MHAVEIRRFGEGVSEPMLQMRAWLGRHRLTFRAAGEAVAFAQAFQGEVLSGGDARAAATTDAEEARLRR